MEEGWVVVRPLHMEGELGTAQSPTALFQHLVGATTIPDPSSIEEEGSRR
jgi:hypothetical protein